MDAQIPQIQIFQNQPEEEEIHLKDYWAVLKRRWWLILLAFVVVVGSTSVYLVRTPRQYEATAVVRVPISGGGGGLASALGAFLPVGPASDVATEIEIIKGRNIAEKVIRDLELDKKGENLKRDWRQIVLGFQGKLKVKQRSGTNLIEITVASNSPEEAKDIADAVADEYVQLSEASSQKVWNDLISQMGAKLQQARTDLGRYRQLLHEYEAKEGITTVFSPLLIGGGASGGYGTQYVVPQAVSELNASIMGMEMQLETLRKNLLPETNPEVISLKNRIAASKEKLQQEEKKAIEKYNKQFGLTSVAAEVLFNQQLYSTLASKQEELKAQYIMQNKSPEIVERAMEPLYPSKPKRKLILMLGAVLGLFLGLGSALFREFLDDSIHTTEDVARSIDLPVLGIIPRFRNVKKNPGRFFPLRNSLLIPPLQKGGKGEFERSALITYYDANLSRNDRAGKFYKESYRMLQLEIMAAIKQKHGDAESQNQRGMILLVTSSVPEEGKSTVAANLAVSVAQTGEKVLLVDADCREPVQHKLLDLDTQMGLIDILAGDTIWNDVVKNTSVDNLYVITSGVEHAANLLGEGSNRPDPSALFISPRLEDFIKSLREHFDDIIFDSPSATLTSEPAAIGSKVDSVVLVIKANDTQKDIILRAKQRMQNSGGNILGAVLNYAAVERRCYR